MGQLCTVALGVTLLQDQGGQEDQDSQEDQGGQEYHRGQGGPWGQRDQEDQWH